MNPPNILSDAPMAANTFREPKLAFIAVLDKFYIVFPFFFNFISQALDTILLKML